MTTSQRNGGQILVEALRRNGADTVYCVAGESYLPVLDALYAHDDIRTITTRHEGAASNMGDAYGKLTGKPGIVMVTRGPGATHAANGVHTAMQDSTPMILFVGQVTTTWKEREGFQEVDYRAVFGTLAKWATEIEDIARIPEVINKAYAVAMSGRKGPVVIALPEDVLFGSAEVADMPPARIAEPAPDETLLPELEALLASAKQPLVLIGGTGWTPAAAADLKTFATNFNLPVAATFRRQDLLDNRDPHYVGVAGLGAPATLVETIKTADVILVLGTRLSEVSTGGYEWIESPLPKQKLIHVHADGAELGRVYQPVLPIHSAVAPMARQLAALKAPAARAWEGWTAKARAEYQKFHAPIPRAEGQTGIELSGVMKHLNEVLPDDAILTNGAGNYTVWLHRFYDYRALATELAPTNGAMGYGFPAAVAAKLHAPDRDVVCFAGDGCFMMYPQELATAVQFGANLIVIVVNNGMLGTIRMHQERTYPERVSATRLVNPDFVAFAQSFGAHAERVDHDADFPAAFERARKAGKPALIELVTDPLQITPAMRIAKD